MPRLTEYLLKLSTDAAELRRYRTVRDEPEGVLRLHSYLTEYPGPGLTSEQAEIVQSHDSRRILQAVLEELRCESTQPENPFHGIPVTFCVEVNRIQTRFPPHPE